MAWCKFQRLRDITATGVDAWLESEYRGQSKGWRPPAVAVTGFTRWAYRTHRLAVNPLAGMRLQESQVTRPSRHLSREQFEAILAVVPKYRQVFYLLAAECGLRWREIARLEWRHLDLERGAVMILNRKGKRADMLPLTDRCVAALIDHKPPTATLTQRV